MNRETPSWVFTALEYHAELPFLPVPGLLLGIAALMFKPFRLPLAVLAMIVAVAATAAIVAMLIGGMMPLYEVPRGL